MTMEATYREATFRGLPSISTDDNWSRSRPSPMAMSIPNSASYDEPPPPLPPPRFVPVDGYDGRPDDDDYKRFRPDIDEGYHSIGSARTPQFSMHNGYQFRRHDAYDSSMLDKLNTRRNVDNPTQWSPLSASARDPRPTPMQLPKLLSLPDRTRLGYSPLTASRPFYRSPLSADSDYDRRRKNSGSVADDVSTQGSVQDDTDFPMEETQDRGQKRRASSPLDEVAPLGSDMFRRRDIISRGSPTPRLTPVPQGQSWPSPISPDSTYSLSRRSSNGRVPHRSPSDARPSLLAAKMQGFYMCDCCPKKPKKFETQEELSAHEAEKQYECSFCGNRFKNKNEAERHQNSLHVRRHSWSCSALTGYERAFHDSTTTPGEADVCGYCGEEFARLGCSARGERFITDADWEKRIRHLQDAHKFRECNASKKFYRADHFRQHLKHSHAGTSGKWTNMLENACMIEEEPPAVVKR